MTVQPVKMWYCFVFKTKDCKTRQCFIFLSHILTIFLNEIYLRVYFVSALIRLNEISIKIRRKYLISRDKFRLQGQNTYGIIIIIKDAAQKFGRCFRKRSCFRFLLTTTRKKNGTCSSSEYHKYMRPTSHFHNLDRKYELGNHTPGSVSSLI